MSRETTSTASAGRVRVLGLDIGTSSVKALLVGEDGKAHASASAPLDVVTPRAGWAEQDPEAWWIAAALAVKSVVASSGSHASDIVGIGLSGQMHSSVFLDRAGVVLRPALLWCDGRTTEECRQIEARVGPKLRDWVSNPALEGFTLPKILWLRNHEPDVFACLAKVVLPKDYIRFRLTGVLASEPSDASATLLYDVARRAWSREMLGAFDLPASIVPELGGSAEVLGTLSADVAAQLGLRAGTPVVGGGADNACGALGVGAALPGALVASWGTSGTVLATTAEPLVDPGLRVHTFCHVVPDTWYCMGVMLSAGAAFAWHRREFARELRNLAGRDDAAAILNAEAATVAIGAEGVTFLPYLQGERTPHRDAEARGAFVGLSLAHTRAHLTRAVLEAICFGLKDSFTILTELGSAPRAVLFTGGGARAPFVRQMLADVFGLPVVASAEEAEGPALGAALLAAVGVGLFSDVASAAARAVSIGRAEIPSAEARAAYEAAYRRFRSLYPLLRSFGHAPP